MNPDLKPTGIEHFTQHLEELRGSLLWSVGAFLIASVICYFFSHTLLDFYIQPLTKYDSVDLFFQKPHEAFLTHLKVSGVTGLFLASPLIFYQFWKFLSPGLYDREKKLALPLLFITAFLFIAGAAFAYFLVIPFGLHFLMSFQTEYLKPLIGISPYFNFLISMMLAFGLLFVFPAILVGLVKIGIFSAAQLVQMRKFVIVMIFIAAAVLTPSPDPVSQLSLALPLMALFEIAILISKRIERSRKSS